MKNRWLMFFVLYFSGLAIGINQFKVPPIMGNLSQIFQVNITSIAWLMSIFTVAGIVLAIPSAKILEKFGPKKLGIILMGLLMIGSLLGAFAPNFTVLLISRVIEGIGFALILLLGMVLISIWFKPEEMSIPTGIFVTFPAVAPFIMYNFSAQIVNQTSWSFLWILGAGLAAIALVLFAIFIKVPEPESQTQSSGNESVSFIEGFSNLKTILLATMQGAGAFILFTFLTIYPLLLSDFYKLAPLKANFYSSLLGLFGIFTCVLSGIIIARTKRPDWINLISFIGVIITIAFTFKLTSGYYGIHIFLISLFTGLVIPSVLTLAPSVVKKPALISYSLAFINFIYFIGTFIGAPVVTRAVEINQGNWTSALIPLIVVAALGFIASLLFFVINRKSMVLAKSNAMEI